MKSLLDPVGLVYHLKSAWRCTCSPSMTISILIVCALALLIGWRIALTKLERVAKKSGVHAHKFVVVKDDGMIRELEPDEIEYLNAEFHPNDGARPYIKSSYEARTPDGRIGGFLLRSKVPASNSRAV